MRRILLLASLVVLVWAAFGVPLPAFIVAPTAATPTYRPDANGASPPSAITVEGAVDEIDGQLLLTTVSVAQTTTLEAIEAAFDPYRSLERRERLIPVGLDEQEFFRAQRDLFEESVKVAAAVGLRLAGIQVTIEGDGAQVEGVVPAGPAEGRLQPGDVIVSVGEEPIDLASELAARTAEAELGARLQLQVQRNGQTQPVEVEVGPIPGVTQQGIGILVSTLDQRISFPQGVVVEDRTDIGGSSAGLMLALTVYELFGPSDLTRGRVIAGTGTVTLDGRVGPIGGVVEKVVGAHLTGAGIFLAPAEQLKEARAAAPEGLTVIGVATVDEAVAALER
ncbi:MAG TPA: PDZ domain-containing protein [Nitriliruptorales bacterium]|nr:PDZ domain-containing protein [Nitriliruptorales bacterium]